MQFAHTHVLVLVLVMEC